MGSLVKLPAQSWCPWGSGNVLPFSSTFPRQARVRDTPEGFAPCVLGLQDSADFFSDILCREPHTTSKWLSISAFQPPPQDSQMPLRPGLAQVCLVPASGLRVVSKALFLSL